MYFSNIFSETYLCISWKLQNRASFASFLACVVDFLVEWTKKCKYFTWDYFFFILCRKVNLIWVGVFIGTDLTCTVGWAKIHFKEKTPLKKTINPFFNYFRQVNFSQAVFEILTFKKTPKAKGINLIFLAIFFNFKPIFQKQLGKHALKFLPWFFLIIT